MHDPFNIQLHSLACQNRIVHAKVLYNSLIVIQGLVYKTMSQQYNTIEYIYCIASNYGLGVYFFPAIFNQATKREYVMLAMNSNGS